MYGSNDLRRRLEVALASGAARDELVSIIGTSDYPFGQTIYVQGNGSTGAYGASDKNDGLSAETPLATMTQAMANIAALNTRYKNDGVIVARGYFAEHVVAPLNAYGWTIVAGSGGLPRHSTSGGVFLTSNGCHWAAAAGGTPLLDLREHGWAVIGLMMVPQASYGAIRLHREETATYPDASHAIISGNRFFGPSTRAGIAIDDYGAGSHCLFVDNKFEDLEFAYKASGVGISAPNRHNFLSNDFNSCKNDICGNFYGTRIEKNVFRTVYNASTHPNTVNMAYTADAGIAVNSNRVFDNRFADAAADVTIAKGYKPATGDVWRNWVSDTAAYVVAVPT
jgi:hypothetical protein